nr:hypothetical protein [Cyanobium sp. WKJ7-Wakatipu]
MSYPLGRQGCICSCTAAAPFVHRCLAALAIANGWRLVSFDRDFERFEGLERLALR